MSRHLSGLESHPLFGIFEYSSESVKLSDQIFIVGTGGSAVAEGLYNRNNNTSQSKEVTVAKEPNVKTSIIMEDCKAEFSGRASCESVHNTQPPGVEAMYHIYGVYFEYTHVSRSTNLHLLAVT